MNSDAVGGQLTRGDAHRAGLLEGGPRSVGSGRLVWGHRRPCRIGPEQTEFAGETIEEANKGACSCNTPGALLLRCCRLCVYYMYVDIVAGWLPGCMQPRNYSLHHQHASLDNANKPTRIYTQSV